MLVLAEIHWKDGSIITQAYTFIQEGSKWEYTDELASDKKLLEYLKYIPPK